MSLEYTGIPYFPLTSNFFDLKEMQSILRLSDYGKKGTSVWKLLSNTNWNKIEAPGRYIIAALTAGRRKPAD